MDAKGLGVRPYEVLRVGETVKRKAVSSIVGSDDRGEILRPLIAPLAAGNEE